MKIDYSAQQIAQILDGKVDGDPSVRIRGVARIESGKGGTICFFANPKYEKYVYTTECDVLIVNEDFVPSAKVHPTLIRVKDAYAAVAYLLEYINSQKKAFRRHRGLLCRVRLSSKIGRRVYIGDFAYVGKRAKVGNDCRIYEQVYIGDDVVVGDRCTFYPGVRIYPGSVIGNNVTLHAGVVIGSDGFGFAPLPDGSYRKIQHSGNVIIEDDVELGANTTVDKSQIGSTIIHKGVKIDNLCQIAHNVEVGDNTVMAALSGIAGSAKVGRNCIVGGQAGIIGHISVPDGTKLAARAGLNFSPKEPGQSFMGYPALKYTHYMRAYAMFKNAPLKKD